MRDIAITPKFWQECWPELTGAKWQAMGRNMVRVFCQDKWHILKLHSFLAKDNIQQLAIVYGHCAQAGLSPQMRPTIRNEYLACRAGQTASLQEFVRQGKEHLPCPHNLGTALARLHKLLKEDSPKGNCQNHLQKKVGHLSSALGGLTPWDKFRPLIKETELFLSSQPQQLLHGDLHRDNVLTADNKIFFIDFDSAFTGPTVWDVSFCAWRVYGNDFPKIKGMLQAYNHAAPPAQADFRWLGPVLVCSIVQRIVFILLKEREGCLRWRADLPKLTAILAQICNDFKIRAERYELPHD